MISFLAHWQNNPRHFHPPPAVPVPVPHKVWILDCRSCGTFLTNRGMKAVLLLRPNVSLFSSDALPVNCSAFTSNPEALRPPSCRPASPPRTCECLTQTLCCHGCGNTQTQCTRCTTSVSSTQRHTNGHRFVFHSSEVVGTERVFVPDEPGVIPCETVPTQNPFLSILTPPLDIADLSPVSSSLPSPVAIQLPSLGLSTSPQPSPLSSPEFGSPPPLIALPQTSLPEAPQCMPLKPGELVFWHHLIRHGELADVKDDPRARRPSKGNSVTFDH